MVLFSWTLLPRDSRGSLNFQMAQPKLHDLFGKMSTRDHLVMKGQFRFLSDTIKTALFFSKTSVRDNRGRPNFQVALTKLFYIWEKVTSL